MSVAPDSLVMNANPKGMLTERQAASACGLTVKSLRELYKLGLIPPPEYLTQTRPDRGWRPIWLRSQLEGLHFE